VFDLFEASALPTALNVKPQTQESILTESERKKQNKAIIIQALERAKGKVSGSGGAAELLAIKPTTLSSRIKKYGIDARAYK